MAEKKETKKAAPKAKKTTEVKEEVVTPQVEQVVEEAKEEVKEEVKVEEKPKTVEEAIEQVDTTIQSSENEELMKKLDEIITPVSEVKLEVDAITAGQKELEKIVNRDLEKAEKTLHEEVKKAEELKKKIDTMINNTKKISNKMNVTSWWNGMGYDF